MVASSTLNLSAASAVVASAAKRASRAGASSVAMCLVCMFVLLGNGFGGAAADRSRLIDYDAPCRQSARQTTSSALKDQPASGGFVRARQIVKSGELGDVETHARCLWPCTRTCCCPARPSASHNRYFEDYMRAILRI